MSIKVNIITRQRKVKLPQNTKELIKKACEQTVICEKFPHNAEVDITLVSDRTIKKINSEFRNINASTDVLSFPMSDGKNFEALPDTDTVLLGDIVISAEHALYQAELFGHGTDREIAYLTVHSMLHLLGYDHVNNEDERKIMRQREETVLEAMGLKIISEK